MCAKNAVVDEAASLIERVRSRDADAFEALYDRYHRLVYGVAIRVLSDRLAAEDVTQTVFLKVWSAPDRFRGGNFGAWIARLARNRAIDLARTRSTYDEGELHEGILVDEGLEETALSNINGERVRRALDELPLEQREPIELGFFGGVTHDQIARRAGLPLGTVKTRIRTGLRRLRNALESAVTV